MNSFKQQQYFSNRMLDWCRNLQPAQESSTQLTFIANNLVSQPPTTRKLVAPKFTGPANQRRLNSENRRGIKTHFSRSFKVDKETQTNIQERPLKNLRDGSTQTVEIAIHPIGSKKNSVTSSRHPSPTAKIDKMNIIKLENCITERTNLLEVSKGTMDYKNELNRQTKASYNMMESQEKAILFGDRSYTVRNIESYHLQEVGRTKNQSYSITFPAQPIMISNLPHKVHHHSKQKMVESIKNTLSEDEQNTFSQKYKNMLRNVQSEFKLSEKKHSERKIRYTPEKRALFHQRQTIVSKYGESFHEERSMRVEESLIYDRDIRSFFTTLGKVESYDSFLMSLAVQNETSILISIKEISVYHMNNISQELLVYRQIQQKKLRVEGLLQLYQTQIDRGSYLFIKEPYTETLKSYIHAENDFKNVQLQIRQIFNQMQEMGFMLKMLPNIEDFVVCYGIVKIQNPGIFLFGNGKKIEIDVAMRVLKQQMSGLQQ